MLKNTKIKILCDGELVNTFSDVGYGIWRNPFEAIPCVGDILELCNELDNKPIRYRVEEREFKTVVSSTPRILTKQEIILYVHKIEKMYCVKL